MTTAVVVKDTPSNQRALISRFGEREFSQAMTVQQFIAICGVYGLNPYLGHITPWDGRPYIQREGWLHLIQREAPGELASLESRPATSDEYKQYGVPSEDYFAIATVGRRSLAHPEYVTTFTRRAIIRARSAKPSPKEQEAQARGAKGRHLVEDPWEMCEKQAQVRALRMAFNDCLKKASPTEEELGSMEEVTVREAPAPDARELVAPPEGANWSRLWAIAGDRGMDKAAVHGFFGLVDNHGDPITDDGYLKDVAMEQAKDRGVSLQQVVEDMADRLEASGATEKGLPAGRQVSDA